MQSKLPGELKGKLPTAKQLADIVRAEGGFRGYSRPDGSSGDARFRQEHPRQCHAALSRFIPATLLLPCRLSPLFTQKAPQPNGPH